VHPSKAKLLWVFLFFLAPVFVIGSMWIAITTNATNHWWLPPDHSTFGKSTDDLFNMVLVITTVAFVGVQIALLWFMYKYAEDGRPRRGLFVHGHHQLEVVWTIVPALILVIIAIVQWGTWLEIKRPANFPDKVRERLEHDEPFADVLAGQFEWRITYPGKDGKFGTRDDVHVLNNFHVPQSSKDEHRPILIRLRSRDVLHSFYLPNFRLKQDAVPGMTIPVWFECKPDTVPEGQETVTFNLMCAELCGWGHYKMKGALTVHKDQASFDKWLDDAKKAEEATQ
jgi:cytochrome c oxidase subunit 2